MDQQMLAIVKLSKLPNLLVAIVSSLFEGIFTLLMIAFYVTGVLKVFTQQLYCMFVCMCTEFKKILNNKSII